MPEVSQREQEGACEREKYRQFGQRPDYTPSSEPSAKLGGDPAIPFANLAFGEPSGDRLAVATCTPGILAMLDGLLFGASAAATQARGVIGPQGMTATTAHSTRRLDLFSSHEFLGSRSVTAGATIRVPDTAASPAGRTLHQ